MIQQYVAQYRSLHWETIRVKPVGKAPAGGKGWPDRLDEPEDFRPEDNVGVKLGTYSGGLTDVDLDCPEAIALAPLFLPKTWSFGRLGPGKAPHALLPWPAHCAPRHYLYQVAGAQTRKNVSSAHVEIRSTGVQTVFPGSIHESGVRIEWTSTDGPLTTLTKQELERHFARLCLATLLARWIPTLEGGGMHDGILACAGSLWHAGWSYEDAAPIILEALALHSDNESHPHRLQAVQDTWAEHGRDRVGLPRLNDLLGSAAVKQWEVAMGYAPQAPPVDHTPQARPLTDTGNAERFADLFGHEVKYVKGIGWIEWCGHVWRGVDEPVVQAAQTARAIQAHEHALVKKHGVKSESAAAISNMLRLAKFMPKVRRTVEDLDTTNHTITCSNGVVDLRTGQLHAANAEALSMKTTKLPFDPEAWRRPSRFARFLGEVLPDEDVRAYVLRFLGYSLFAETTEQKFCLWHGHGANGKSTLLKAVFDALGDYVKTMAPDMLIERRFARSSDAPAPDLVDLHGVRMAIGEETKVGQRWNEALLKQLVDSTRIKARSPYDRDMVEFKPTAKIILAVNHKPAARGQDRGLWRRMHLVLFGENFEGREDRGLEQTLWDERVIVLSTLVRAAQAWHEDGLCPPTRVIEAVKEYQDEQDLLGQFLDEVCVRSGSVRRSVLYPAYRNWATDGNEYCMGKHAFNLAMKERGFEIKGSGREWQGISLQSQSGMV